MEISTDIELQTASSLDLRPKSNRFKYELNLGLALPTKFRVEKGYDIQQEHESLVKSVDDDGSVAMVKIKTQSNQGPLGAFDNDVLTVLLTMAYEQKDHNERNQFDRNGYRVYYTLYEICRRLNLNLGNAGNVSESIEKIASQNLTLDNFAYASGAKKAVRKNESTKIIIKKGRVVRADGDSEEGEYTSYFYIEFDQFVVRNLYNDYASVLSSKKYLSLNSGPTRRIFIFLTSKRKIFGDKFSFNLFELTRVLGICESTPQRQREYISKYLPKVSKEVGTFSFLVQKEKGRKSWDILIEFHEEELLLEEPVDQFYSKVKKYYGEKYLEKLNLLEVDFINYREEFSSKYKAVKGSTDFLFQGELVNPADFAIDIALFQVVKQHYPITKSFKALAHSILLAMAKGPYDLPEGFRYFIDKRIMSIEKKEQKIAMETEKQRQTILKDEEDRKLDKAFREFYKNIVMKNKRQMGIYEEKADLSLRSEGYDEDSMMWNILLTSEIEKLAKQDFQTGNSMHMAQKDGKLLLN